MSKFDALKITSDEQDLYPKWNALIDEFTTLDSYTRQVFHSNGNVGIGTRGPLEQALTVDGDINVKDSIHMDTNGGRTSAIIQAFDGGSNKKTSGLYISQYPADGNSDAMMGLFRFTNTTGACDLVIFRGNGKPEVNARIGAKGRQTYFARYDGNVGIGMDKPDKKLTVNGDTRIAGEFFADKWVRIKGQKGIFFRDYGGGLHMTDKTWVKVYNGKSFKLDKGTLRTDGALHVGASGSRFVVTGPGAVGIGVKNPTKAKLEINGRASFRFNLHSYVGYNNTKLPQNQFSVSTGNKYLSIHASSGIAGVSFRAYSDGRMKTALTVSNGAEDLAILNKIEVMDFVYKDHIAHGSDVQKKVIAQQVAAVYPQAVSASNTEVIPDICVWLLQKMGGSLSLIIRWKRGSASVSCQKMSIMMLKFLKRVKTDSESTNW